jgi:hypothetical protein
VWYKEVSTFLVFGCWLAKKRNTFYNKVFENWYAGYGTWYIFIFVVNASEK